MSKLALLYEVRGERQRKFLANAERLNTYENLENLTLNPSQFRELITNQQLSNFKLLMLHKSDIDVAEVEPICKENKIAFVLFSGGITQTLYTDSLGFPYLKINSKDFYSPNLFPFLANFFENPNSPNLLQFAYGENWKLSIYLKMKQAISMLKFEKEKWGEWRNWEKYADLYLDIYFNDLSKTAFNDLSIFPDKETLIDTDNLDSLFNSWESQLTNLINPYFI